MFLLYEYDIFWAFLIISSLIPILAFFISGILAPIRKGPEKLSSYESGIEPMGDAWLQFRIRYYMFALVFVVFDVETVFLTNNSGINGAESKRDSARTLLRNQSNKSIMISNPERLNTSKIRSNIPKEWEHVGIRIIRPILFLFW